MRPELEDLIGRRLWARKFKCPECGSHVFLNFEARATGDEPILKLIPGASQIELEGRVAIAPTDVEYLKELADSLDLAPRQGHEVDIPEGHRFIQFSDTVIREISKRLRQILKQDNA